ncbi:hypothetical protein B8W96_11505 [Lentilactobacillus parakefiri]|uniref:Uncharacterized protein n=1 Tax=Lentilactobacillus parakefiri TaxID=152332 RepID=A0A269YET5_9LACO|nr:hypothetical protein B8W98_06110 [Lentilactobacillus parakefiri]PAK99454.1 hypothetical protein B8W96_11505 [Lentilactobacillus parakefiri]
MVSKPLRTEAESGFRQERLRNQLLPPEARFNKIAGKNGQKPSQAFGWRGLSFNCLLNIFPKP